MCAHHCLASRCVAVLCVFFYILFYFISHYLYRIHFLCSRILITNRERVALCVFFSLFAFSISCSFSLSIIRGVSWFMFRYYAASVYLQKFNDVMLASIAVTLAKIFYSFRFLSFNCWHLCAFCLQSMEKRQKKRKRKENVTFRIRE